MKISIRLKSSKTIILPIDYNHIVQAFIYNHIDEKLAKFLHDEGYVYENRKFKFFTFSKIIGEYSLDKLNKKIYFVPNIEIIIKTPIENFAKSLLNNIILTENLNLGENKVSLDKYEISIDKVEEKEEETIVKVKTLSPITVYSTLKEGDGKDYTCYFLPGEPKFEKLINGNIQKKAEIMGVKVQDPIHILSHRGRERLITYKSFIIKAYDGVITLKGNTQLINLAISCGLGSKNSQGLGCIEVIKILKGGEN